MKVVPKRFIWFINRKLCKYNIDLLLVPYSTFVDILFKPLEEKIKHYEWR